MGLCRDLDKLTPKAKDCAEKAIAILKAQGIRFFVNETLRTQSVQNAYYAQGRKTLEEVNQLRTEAGLWLLTAEENKKQVTQTTKSIHLSGRAMDVVPADKNGNPWWGATKEEYQKIADVMKTCGWEWGGDWKGSWDQPHYQLKDLS